MKRPPKLTRKEKKRKYKTKANWIAEKRKGRAEALNNELNNPEHTDIRVEGQTPA